MPVITSKKISRNSITDVHSAFTSKLGKAPADVLTRYLEDTIPTQIEDKIQFLATKEDIANVRADLKEDIANVRAEVTKVELKLSQDIAKVEVKVAQLETQLFQFRGELKEDIAKVKSELKEDISKLNDNISKSIASQSKWMLATIITIVLAVLALLYNK